MGAFELFVLILYCLPAGIAYFVRHPQWRWVALASLLLGWTGVGWLVAMAAALNPNSLSFIEYFLAAQKADTDAVSSRDELEEELLALVECEDSFVREKAQQGLEQLNQLSFGVETIKEFIDGKLSKNELSYQRQSAGVERAEMALRNYLRLVVDLLKNLELHAAHNIAARVEEAGSASSLDEKQQRELEMLQESSAKANSQTARVEDQLSRNESILEQLRKLSSAWSEVEIVSGKVPPRLETAIDDLEHLEQMVSAYAAQ